MKITVVVKPDSDQLLAVSALMAESKLKETQRVVVGGGNTDIQLVLTFEGNDDHYRLFYNSSYVEIEERKGAAPGDYINPYSTFYSLACLNGCRARHLKDFKEYLKNCNKTKIVIKKL